MERYESLGLIGEGSYGTVLKSRHRDTGRLVAIKKFMDSDSDKTVKKIAMREIKLLRKLRHDNLVNLLEVWRRRRRWYLVFEFVERTLLEDLEQTPSGLDLNTTRQYLYQILRATAFCHEQNIIHRDIKPENILISQGGVVKLCDFGLARTMVSSAEGGIYTDYVATRWYRAPELLVGDVKYGKPVDVWAVGCLFLEMLTAQPLFPGDSDLDQIYHIIKCFGNLTVHHQELFYRNPVFSGVRLPECSSQVSLQERCPTITPSALDLAQNCLQMDPEARAQCSNLLEHPLFTQDCFHIRFLDELKAKIQNDYRENATLPKITTTPRQDKDDGNDKKQKAKEKKQLGDGDEKANKVKEKKDRMVEEKMEKTKGKQPSKTNRNTLEVKVINTTTKASVGIKGKPATCEELIKEPDITKSAKILCFDSSDGTKTGTGLKENNTVAPKSKHIIQTNPDQKKDYLQTTKNAKDTGSTSLLSSYSDIAVPSETEKNIWRASKLEPSQGFGKSWSNANTNLHKFSYSSATDHPNVSLSSQASLESTGTSLGLQAYQQSSDDHIEITTLTIPSVTKSSKTITALEHQSIITVPQTLKSSDNEDRHDFMLSVSIGTATTSLLNQISNISGSSSNEQRNSNGAIESDGSNFEALTSEPQINVGSFCNHTDSTATINLKAQKTPFHTEARKKSDNPGRNDTIKIPSIADLTSVPSTVTPDQSSFVLHNTDTAAFNEALRHSYPPPPPSSTPLLLPQPSTAVMPPSSVISTNSPHISNHLSLGMGFHPVNHNPRGVDKPRQHGGIYSRQSLLSHFTQSVTAQVSDRNLICEQSFLPDHSNFGNSGGVAMAKKRSDIHFPDLRSSALPELRGRDGTNKPSINPPSGKHSKGIIKDQRKDKQPVTHISPSEPQQYRHDSTDTHHTPKH